MRWIYILLILLVFSCKKESSDSSDPIIETIYPKPYLPVYPGSWWIYVNGYGDSIESSIGEYEEHSYPDITQNGAQSTVVKVPYWNGNAMYEYSYPRRINTNDNGLTLVPFLTEHLGDQWNVTTYQGAVESRETVVIDTSIVVEGIIYNHVIQINKYLESPPDSIPKTLVSESFFAKDIGLIQENQYEFLDPLGGIKLRSYFINH